MAMTAAVKDEISRLPVTRTCCRKAEVSADPAVRRRPAPGERAHRDRGGAGHRRSRPGGCSKDILEIFGHGSDLVVMAPGGLRRGCRYVVRVVAGGDQLARQTGLVDGRGPPDPGPAPAGGLRRDLRRRGGLARRLPGARLAHRARPLLLAGGDLPGPGGRARPGRRGPPARRSRPRPARCAASTGSWSATATRSAPC